MNTRLIKTLQHVRELLAQASLLEPEWESKDECYQWVEGVLRHFRYQSLTRSEKGLIKRYLTVATGYSRAQITRLISAYLSQGRLRRKQRTSNGFTSQYTTADIRLLAATTESLVELFRQGLSFAKQFVFQRGRIDEADNPKRHVHLYLIYCAVL